MTSAKARQAPSLVRSSGEVIAFLRMGMISPKIRSPFLRHNSPSVREAVYDAVRSQTIETKRCAYLLLIDLWAAQKGHKELHEHR